MLTQSARHWRRDGGRRRGRQASEFQPHPRRLLKYVTSLSSVPYLRCRKNTQFVRVEPTLWSILLSFVGNILRVGAGTQWGGLQEQMDLGRKI